MAGGSGFIDMGLMLTSGILKVKLPNSAMKLRSAPSTLAVLGDRVYAAGQDDPNILVMRDCITAAPAARTPTPTATPYVTATPTPASTAVGKAPTARPKAP